MKVERTRTTKHGARAPFRSFWLASFDAVDHLPGIRLPGDGFDPDEYAARVDVSRVVERPGWEDPRYWRGRRLWDVLLHATHHAPRVRDSAYDQALREVRSRIDPLVASSLHGNPS